MAFKKYVMISSVDRLNMDQILVHFSDGMYAVYTTDQLMSLPSERHKLDEAGKKDV
jgi:hypothetical protein